MFPSPLQLFGYKLTSCQVEGAQQLCPPGLTFQDCPSHFDCYVACDASLALQWFNVSGSPYGDMAYCEAFPRQQYADGNTTGVQYWAQVGKPDNMDNNYDQIWTAFLSAFIILTGDSYDQYMKQVGVGAQSRGRWEGVWGCVCGSGSTMWSPHGLVAMPKKGMRDLPNHLHVMHITAFKLLQRSTSA